MKEATQSTADGNGEIPGTTIFDGAHAMAGYDLNRMCYSFNSAKRREEFKKDEDAYCRKFGLTEKQTDAIRKRDVLALLNEGANIYYLAKFAGIFGLNVQDIGAQQRHMSVEAFKKFLLEQGK